MTAQPMQGTGQPPADAPQRPPLARLYELSPTATAASRATIAALYGHTSAPRWNHPAGDRLTHEDVAQLAAFANTLRAGRGVRSAQPDQHLLAWAQSRIAATPLYRGRVLPGLDIFSHWAQVPTSSREDIACHAERLVPDDVALERMIMYRTAGTTGHALLVAQDALAVACYLPLLDVALARYGVETRFQPEETACFLVGSQRRTVTYPTVLSGWGGAGFAKLNLFADDWPAPQARADYFRHFAPRLLTGDPLSFADMLEAGIAAAPRAMVTTAVAMSGALKTLLQTTYGCPVIDWYSLTETGPLGYACPQGHGYHWLPHDVHLETLDAAGQPTRGRGEITVTGGRNPYIPLLRYRTGDWGRIDFTPCPCGDTMPRLLDLEGRAPVRFHAASGAAVGTQDVATVLRRYPLVQHRFEQAPDGTCALTYRTLAGATWSRHALEAALHELFGYTVVLHEDAQLGRRGLVDKVIPYVSKRVEE
jgi:phenylacetate-CoA ligase